LDTLAVIGDLEEFATAIKRVTEDVTVNNDVVVSVFETNIRVLGGILSAHILASLFRSRGNKHLLSYNDELLKLAEDIGNRLLPAFDTKTGLPYPRVNLKYGVNRTRPDGSVQSDTCTACAGSHLMEFAALSRLTGNPVYEETAKKAMEAIWQSRDKNSNLVGNVINVNTGRWVRQDAGIGAGIDSYYEYCLKSYILLGDNIYWDRFQKHYAGIMRYVKLGAAMVDVYLGNPLQRAKSFMDALLAFWPGLQVLTGDLKPAVSTHHMLFHVMKQHKFIPEAFTVDFRVHWAQHLLRPEFVESTYFLYLATKDPHYLRVGEEIINSLQNYARVPCGFAAVQDVRTFAHEDRMDSFVLAETFKYLYLLFTEDDELDFDIHSFIFTTEAHLLPLSLANLNTTSQSLDEIEDLADEKKASDHQFEKGISNRSCVNLAGGFGGMAEIADNVRDELMVSLTAQKLNTLNSRCQYRAGGRRRRIMKAEETDLTNPDHIRSLLDMGVVATSMGDGRMQITHNAAKAASAEHAEAGLLFLQELVNKVKDLQQENKQKPVSVQIIYPDNLQNRFTAGPALFGPLLHELEFQSVTGAVQIVDPNEACGELRNGGSLHGQVALIRRGSCMFSEKVANVQSVGAIAAIIVDNREETEGQLPFVMSADPNFKVDIPSVFLLKADGELLWSYAVENEVIQIRLLAHTYNDGECEHGKDCSPTPPLPVP
jgi:mannosidase alpha-like ER degradation enhancer 3